VSRWALSRAELTVEVHGQPIRLKVVRTPGGNLRAKPEFDDVADVASRTGLDPRTVAVAALAAFEARPEPPTGPR
jgi:uncharacterized protein (DUF111 family)